MAKRLPPHKPRRTTVDKINNNFEAEAGPIFIDCDIY